MSGKSLATRLIEEAIENKSKFLDLGNCGLTDDSPELKMLEKCDFLEGLNLGEWYSTDRGFFKTENNFIQNYFLSIPYIPIINLKSLFISDVFLEKISNLSHFVRLESIDLSNNSINKIENLNELYSLEELDISDNDIIEIKNLDALINLQELNLSTNGITEIKNLDALINLQSLDLSDNNIFKIDGLNNLVNLEDLDLSFNRILKIENLQSLYNLIDLDLSNNRIIEIERIEKLIRLETIFLTNNKISSVGQLPVIINQLENISLSGNPLNISLSDYNNVDIWKAYFANQSNLQNQLQSNKYIKLNVIGDGRIGKSQLIKFLITGVFKDGERETDGMQQYNHTFKKSNISVSIWDFGGQNYYHGTHQLFIRKQDANIVVWGNHAAPNKHDDPLRMYNYWLGTARNLSNADSPLLLLVQSVWSEKDDKTIIPLIEDLRCYNINNDHLFALDVKKAFNKDKQWLRKWNYFTEVLEEELKEQVSKQGKIDNAWMLIHAQLIDLKKTENIILKKDFIAKYAHSIPQEEIPALLSYLEFAGSALYFNEPSLENYVIINPTGLSNWIHKNINNSKDKDGRLSKNELKNIFKEKLEVFLLLMERFELIFKDEKSSVKNPVYVFPQFLPDNNTSFKNALLDLVPYTFSLKYPDYFHEGRFFNFMSKYGKYAESESAYWKYGILFKHPTFNLNTIVYYDRSSCQITAHIEDKKGKTIVAKEMFEFFAYENYVIVAEQEKRNKNIKQGEEWQKHLKTKNTDNNFVFFRNLQLSTSKNTFIEVEKSIKNIEANNFFAINTLNNEHIKLDFMSINLLNKNNDKKHRVFFSYSHKDEKYRDELEVHFAMLKNSGKIETWHDRKIMLGQDWDAKIEEQLREADIILLLLSSDFLNSGYIWNKELGIIRERLRTQPDSLKVIPIFLRPCDTNEFDMMAHQGAPRDTNGEKSWIISNRWHSRDEAYLEVINGLRAALV